MLIWRWLLNIYPARGRARLTPPCTRIDPLIQEGANEHDYDSRHRTGIHQLVNRPECAHDCSGATGLGRPASHRHSSNSHRRLGTAPARFPALLLRLAYSWSREPLMGSVNRSSLLLCQHLPSDSPAGWAGNPNSSARYVSDRKSVV